MVFIRLLIYDHIFVNPTSDISTIYSMMETTDETVSSAVKRAAGRLPPYCPNRTAVSFSRAEAQFEFASITRQRTKFNYVVSNLNQQQASALEGNITSTPEQEIFDRLKLKLVRQLSTSRKQRLRQPLLNVVMGDREVWSLAPDVPDDFLRTICASQLPPHVKGIFASQTEGCLD